MDPTTIKMADTESDTPPRSLPIKPLSFTNDTSLKIYYNPPLPPFTAEVVAYKECLKNHAASLGSHAVDGCGEFMPSPECTTNDPTSLKCAVCGCHRNFHRRYHNNESAAAALFTPATHFLEFHHHQSPPTRRRRGSTSSPPPPPPPISYASHMLLALSTGMSADENALQIATPGTPPTAVKTENHRHRHKRFRSKFSQEQKEKMSAFSEKLGWKMPRSDDKTVAEFCNEVGIRRGVLKVWMHNNKNTFGKKEKENCTFLPTTVAAATDNAGGNTNNDATRISFDNKNNNTHVKVSTNGSSSSS